MCSHVPSFLIPTGSFRLLLLKVFLGPCESPGKVQEYRPACVVVPPVEEAVETTVIDMDSEMDEGTNDDDRDKKCQSDECHERRSRHRLQRQDALKRQDSTWLDFKGKAFKVASLVVLPKRQRTLSSSTVNSASGTLIRNKSVTMTRLQSLNDIEASNRTRPSFKRFYSSPAGDAKESASICSDVNFRLPDYDPELSTPGGDSDRGTILNQICQLEEKGGGSSDFHRKKRVDFKEDAFLVQSLSRADEWEVPPMGAPHHRIEEDTEIRKDAINSKRCTTEELLKRTAALHKNVHEDYYEDSPSTVNQWRDLPLSVASLRTSKHDETEAVGSDSEIEYEDVEDDRLAYHDYYSCMPPPIFMLGITLLELGFFIYHTKQFLDDPEYGSISKYGPAPMESLLIYDPTRRSEIWRYITYAFVHSGYMHIINNIVIQLVLGILLEMVHKWWRVLAIYFAGVLAGSLATSIAEPYHYLAGASAGVYALIAAHLSTVILNWSEMEHPWVRVLVFVAFAIHDSGTAFYWAYIVGEKTNVGYAAHLGGAVAGLLVGIHVLKNLQWRDWERVLWYISVVICLLLLAFAVIWNIFRTDVFP